MGGWIAHPNPEHWIGGGVANIAQKAVLQGRKLDGGGSRRPNSYQQDIWTEDATGETHFPKRKSRNAERKGFSDGSSPDCLTDEQREDLIAENIYDWWISGKSYKKWYADKFMQLELGLEFEE